MWGDEPQLEAFRERLKVLLEAHEQDLNPQVITAEEGTVLCRQGEPVDTLMLLRKGRVAVDLHQGPLVHTLAEIDAVELLGEVGFFANGQHYADMRVVNGPAELATMKGEQMLKAMLYDTDLVVELLSLVSERCRRGNRVIGLLLNGIEAVHKSQSDRLQHTSDQLGGIHFCVGKASDQLKELHDQLMDR